jgi:heme/copper-type cytochrome/quinol oxidase subunit 2
MNSKVVVEENDDYQAWLAEQSTFADLLAAAGSGADDETKLVLNATADSVKPEAAQ